jgi:hypothetical protein
MNKERVNKLLQAAINSSYHSGGESYAVRHLVDAMSGLLEMVAPDGVGDDAVDTDSRDALEDTHSLNKLDEISIYSRLNVSWSHVNNSSIPYKGYILDAIECSIDSLRELTETNEALRARVQVLSAKPSPYNYLREAAVTPADAVKSLKKDLTDKHDERSMTKASPGEILPGKTLHNDLDFGCVDYTFPVHVEDAPYNPMMVKDDIYISYFKDETAEEKAPEPVVMVDYTFPVHVEGRGSKVETLPGADEADEVVSDLEYFAAKLDQGHPVEKEKIIDREGESRIQLYTDGLQREIKKYKTFIRQRDALYRNGWPRSKTVKFYDEQILNQRKCVDSIKRDLKREIDEL